MRAATVFALALTVAMASPAFAQKGEHGKGHAKGTEKQKTEVEYKQHTDKRGNVVGEYKQNVDGRKVQYQTRNGVVTSVKSKGSPAFCRSGSGHPVYGRSWCVQKGFGLGNANWNRVTWGDVVLQPRRASISDVLSSVVLGRLTNYAAQRLGLTSPLYGSWLNNTTDRRVYIVRSGSVPVAEMVDVNGDRRADYVLLYNR